MEHVVALSEDYDYCSKLSQQISIVCQLTGREHGGRYTLKEIHKRVSLIDAMWTKHIEVQKRRDIEYYNLLTQSMYARMAAEQELSSNRQDVLNNKVLFDHLNNQREPLLQYIAHLEEVHARMESAFQWLMENKLSDIFDDSEDPSTDAQSALYGDGADP